MHRKGSEDVHKMQGVALTAHQCRQLSVAALGMDERTIRAAYANPSAVRNSSLLRLTKAAKALGFPVPGAARGVGGSS